MPQGFEKKVDLFVNTVKSVNNKQQKIKNIYIAEVISIDDPYDAGRIKARISGLDDKLSNDDLPYCHAYLPKILMIMPKVGEAVRITLSDIDKPYKERLWSGPITSQPQNIKKDPYHYSAKATLEGAFVNPKEAPSTITDALGVYPDKEDIALLGRDNADIILKPRELTLRAGKNGVSDNLKLNKDNPAYIKLKLSDDGKESHAITVANNIYLLSHNGNPNINPIIDDKILAELKDKLHPLPYGDVLLQCLNLIIQATISHVHPYTNKSAVDSVEVINLKNFDLNSINSKNIKIN